MRELLSYAHPALALFTIFFAYFVFRDGFAQRKLRLRKTPPPSGSRARHVRWAPFSTMLMITTALGGLISAVFIRDWKPLGTFHGWLGTFTTVLFLFMWWQGRRLVAGMRDEAARHGVIGLLALFAAGITGVLGIALLP